MKLFSAQKICTHLTTDFNHKITSSRLDFSKTAENIEMQFSLLTKQLIRNFLKKSHVLHTAILYTMLNSRPHFFCQRSSKCNIHETQLWYFIIVEKLFLGKYFEEIRVIFQKNIPEYSCLCVRRNVHVLVFQRNSLALSEFI